MTALRGMMDTAKENAAMARATFEEAAAVFDGEMDDREEVEAATTSSKVAHAVAAFFLTVSIIPHSAVTAPPMTPPPHLVVG